MLGLKTHLLARGRSQRQASVGGTAKDHPIALCKDGFLVRAVRVHPEFEHPKRPVKAAVITARALPLADIDDEKACIAIAGSVAARSEALRLTITWSLAHVIFQASLTHRPSICFQAFLATTESSPVGTVYVGRADEAALGWSIAASRRIPKGQV